jgi:predicted phosphodiesterase
MKLNVLSDLHLSLAALAMPENEADVVVLAGDIARPKEAIAWASGFVKPVLYVPGNHEFYGGSIAGTVEELKRLDYAVDRFHAVRRRGETRGRDAGSPALDA